MYPGVSARIHLGKLCTRSGLTFTCSCWTSCMVHTPWPPPKAVTTCVTVALAMLPGLSSHLAGRRRSHPAATAGSVRRRSAGGCRRGREGRTPSPPRCGSRRPSAPPSPSVRASRAGASAQGRAQACRRRAQCARAAPRGAGSRAHTRARVY